MSLYLAVGNDKEWEKFSKPKRIELEVVGAGAGYIELGNKYSVEWDVRRSCTLTHFYLLSASHEIVHKDRMVASKSVLRRDRFTIFAGNLTISNNFDGSVSREPYLI